jgi:hypothetical protein
MAENKTQQQNEKQTITREDVDAMAKIVDGLKQEAEQAASANNRAAAKMLQLAVKQLSPIVTKGYARLAREELAALNKKVNPPKYKLVRQPIA